MRIERFFTGARGWMVLGLGWLAATAQGQTLGLPEALRAARAHDPRFQAALHEFDVSREYRVAGSAARSAEVSASATAARNLLAQRGDNSERNSAYGSSSLSVQLRKPVYAPELEARERMGEAQSRQGEAVLAQRDADLIQRLVDAYAQAVVARGQLAAAEALIQTLEQQSRSVQRMIELGEGTRTDQFEVNSRLLLARSRRIEIVDALRDAGQRLAIIVGDEQPTTPRTLLPGFAPLVLEPTALAQWEAHALQQNAVLRARRHAVAAAHAEAARADASYKPRVDVVVGYARSDSDSANTLNQVNAQRSIGLQMSLPLYTGGRLDSAARQAIARAAQTEAELLEAQATVLADVRQYFDQVLSTVARIEALRAAREAAGMQVQATRRSMQGGIRVTLDVLNAESQVYQVESDLVRARVDHLRVWVRLRASAGVLTDADILRLDALFDPTAAGDAGGR